MQQYNTKLQVLVLLVVVFVMGGVSGAALDALYRHRSGAQAKNDAGDHKDSMLKHLQQDLALSDAQSDQVRIILQDVRKEMPLRKLESVCPNFKEVRDHARARIREVLTPEQQKKFDELHAQREAEAQSKQTGK